MNDTDYRKFWLAITGAFNSEKDGEKFFETAKKYVLKKKADPNKPHTLKSGQEGGAALHLAIKGFGRPYPPPRRDRIQPLFEAFFNAGANLELEDKVVNNQTPLHLAARVGLDEALKFLIEKKVNLDKGDEFGRTALLFAAMQNHVEAVKMLINAKADVHKTMDGGATPLYIAALNGQLGPVNLLITAGARVNQAQEKEGATPVCIAVEKGHKSVVSALIDKKADVNIARNDGLTPLYIAAENGNAEIVQLLLDAGADAQYDTPKGTALEIAQAKGHVEVAKRLEIHLRKNSSQKKLSQSAVSSSEKIENLNVNLPLVSGESLRLGNCKVLGQGAFGTVYLGEYHHQVAAIKLLKVKNFSEGTVQEFKNEAQVMSNLRHPNIVQIYAACTESPHFALVMEYCPKGSLYSLLNNSPNLDWKIRYTIVMDILAGLEYMHAQTPEVLHRDLKSANVMLDDRLRAKLTDFGLAKVKSESSTATQDIQTVGTIAWMAPELFERKPVYSQASDIFALAVLLWEVASQKSPFADAASAAMIMLWIQRGDREEIPEQTPPKLKDVISRCWFADKSRRPMAKAVIEELSEEAKMYTSPLDSSPSSSYAMPSFINNNTSASSSSYQQPSLKRF